MPLLNRGMHVNFGEKAEAGVTFVRRVNKGVPQKQFKSTQPTDRRPIQARQKA